MGLLYSVYSNAVANPVSGNNWFSQSFLATANQKISKVAIYCKKTGSPSGNIILSIRAALKTDSGTGTDQPTGSDLVTSTIAVSGVPTSEGWFTFPFASQLSITNDNLYAVVVRLSAGDASNRVDWYGSSTSIYAGGKYTTSSNAGVSWATDSSKDISIMVYSPDVGGSPMLFGGGVTIA